MYILMYIDSMGAKYSVAEARTNLPDILDQAEAGNPVMLTRRGKSVAVVISCRDLENLRSRRKRFADAYSGFLKQYNLREVGVGSGFVSGLRERSAGRKVSL